MFANAADELLARLHIQETLLRFCRGIDRKDWPLLLSAFHEDATDDHGWVKGRAHDVLVPALQSRHLTVTHSVHYLTNISIAFVSTSMASVESYVLVAQRQVARDGVGEDRTMAAVRYVDRLEARDSCWRIASRVLVYGDMFTVSDEATFALPDGFTQQRRDVSDPITMQESVLGIFSSDGSTPQRCGRP
jgi:hypothetical protein